MRKFISLAVVVLLASSMSAQTIANMKDLNAEKKSAAINLKLTGTLTTTKIQISASFVISAGS